MESRKVAQRLKWRFGKTIHPYEVIYPWTFEQCDVALGPSHCPSRASDLENTGFARA